MSVRESALLKAREIERALIKRQKEIKKEKRTTSSEKEKEELGIEEQGNTHVLRELNWLIMSLRNIPLKDKLKVDHDFPNWYHNIICIYVYDYACNVLGCEFRSRSPWSIFHYNHLSQCRLWNVLINKIFEEFDGCGLFGLMEDYDAVINKEILTGLPQKEYFLYKDSQMV